MDLSSVSLGIEKGFFDKKLTVNLTANDIFHEIRYDGEYTLGETDIVYYNTTNFSNIRLSLSYAFGQLKTQAYKNKTIADTETQRAE